MDMPTTNLLSMDPAPWPNQSSLRGSTVTLTKLRTEHASGLYPLVGGRENAEIWNFLPVNVSETPQDFQESIKEKAQATDCVFYAIIDNETEKPMGHLCLMRIDQKNRVIEVGNILFAPCLQRTRQATEALYLLAKYVFEELGYRRYEWKCDALNVPSRKAALRLGFIPEGIFRQHMIYKGRNRDTAWHSMLDSEWPTIKHGFQMWLHDDNFDPSGKQVLKFEECRRRAETITHIDSDD